MSDVSAILGLPYIQPSQSQKHVTHNEALASLDALVQAAVKGRTLVTPPAAPQTGDAWLVAPSGAVNAWAGQENALTWWDGAGWRFAAPRPGWTVYDLAEGGPLVFDAAQGWIRLPVSLDGLDMLGVNGAADATNRLAVSSSAVLLNHQGAGHQLKINKAGATDTASLMFQTGFSGRAEMGTAGNNDFSIKVSPDGAAWTEALRVDRTSGQVTGAAVQSGPSDATPGRLMKTGAFGIGGLSPFLSDISVTDNSLPAGGVFGFSTAGGRYRRAGGGHTRPDDPVAPCHGRRRGAGDGRRRGIGDPPGHHAVAGAHLGRLVALAARAGQCRYSGHRQPDRRCGDWRDHRNRNQRERDIYAMGRWHADLSGGDHGGLCILQHRLCRRFSLWHRAVDHLCRHIRVISGHSAMSNDLAGTDMLVCGVITGATFFTVRFMRLTSGPADYVGTYTAIGRWTA